MIDMMSLNEKNYILDYININNIWYYYIISVVVHHHMLMCCPWLSWLSSCVPGVQAGKPGKLKSGSPTWYTL